LVHALYEIVASSEKLDDLAELAIRDGDFWIFTKAGSTRKRRGALEHVYTVRPSLRGTVPIRAEENDIAHKHGR